MGKICNMMENKDYKSELEKQSLKLIKMTDHEQETLDCLYVDLAKKESGEEIFDQLDDVVKRELDSLNRTAANLNKAIKITDTMRDELKARRRDTKSGIIKDRLPSNTEIDYKESKGEHFAKGMNIYKILLIMVIGSVVGVIVEMLFCLFKNGYIESRTCTGIGPFNIVYGLGAVCLSFFLYKYRNRGVWLSFIGGMIVGSVVEYLCSFFQEMLFGSTSWDYSALPFNLNGRICLLYSIFWGILGVWWIKDLYPLMSQYILKIPNKIGKTITVAATVFLLLDYCLSGVVVFRWMNRVNDKPAENIIAEVIDNIYPNEKMEKIYPNLVFKK